MLQQKSIFLENAQYRERLRFAAIEKRIAGLDKTPKIWQFWMPRIIGIDYNVMYIPNFYRNEFSRKIKQVLVVNYKPKGKYMFILPTFVYGGTQYFGKTASFGTMFSKAKMLVKPFVSSVLTSIVGFTFRFKLFLRVKGLGYKAYIVNSGKTLNLKLGFSHIVIFNFQNEMFATKLGVKDRMFSVEGSNWVILTNVIARIQNLKKIDYYRGKGIFKKFNSCKIRISRKKKK